jgi:hypothetical protein
MHTDRREVIGWNPRLSAAGDWERYAHPGNFSQDEKVIRTYASITSEGRERVCFSQIPNHPYPHNPLTPDEILHQLLFLP